MSTFEGVIKCGAILAALAAGSSLAACSKTSASNGVVPSAASPSIAAAQGRVILDGSVVPASSLPNFSKEPEISRIRDVRIVKAASPLTLYASLFEGMVFAAYKLPNVQPFCQNPLVQPAFVNGIGTDSSGNLWLPTQVLGKAGAIYSYAPDCGAQGPTLSVPVNAEPVGIAIGRGGTKYALMAYEVSGSKGNKNDGAVSVYPPGATSPAAELSDPRLNDTREPVDGIAVDGDHVYVTCCLANRRDRFVIKFKEQGSQQRGKKIVLALLRAPGVLTFDRSHNMIVPDTGDATLKIYAPPYAAAPTVYSLRGTPFQCALSRNGQTLACTNLNDNTADLYAYPSMAYSYSVQLDPYPNYMIGGVAFYPGS